VKKIPTAFLRDENDRRFVTDDPNPACDWVFAGEGVPTRKYDGTCVMFDGFEWWARREVKPGKTPPDGWVLADHDETTGKSMGWEPVVQSAFAKFHAEALESKIAPEIWVSGTYELVGPKVNGNPEDQPGHVLVSHDRAEALKNVPVDYDNLVVTMADLRHQGIEGIVWHHPDGRMAKLKVRDFDWTKP
jgi:hypothetical protein